MSNLQPQIAIVTDDPGWHGKELTTALEHHGLGAHYLTLTACQFTFDNTDMMVRMPGFEHRLPLGVFVRGVPGGSLEQVIFRLDILHALVNLGIVVYNEPRAIERTVDKAMTSFLLHFNGVATPSTWVCESREQAHDIILRETMAGGTLVIKPLFGSQGQGVRRLEHGTTLPVPMDEHVDGLYYLQSYIDSGEGAWHDHRVFVINGKAVGAMLRHGSGWVNNVALGGRCEFLPPSGEIAELALAATAAVEVDYCGVDIIRDRLGRLFVLEVNSIPAWKGLQGVVNIDIAQALVDDFLGKLGREQSMRAVAS